MRGDRVESGPVNRDDIGWQEIRNLSKNPQNGQLFATFIAEIALTTEGINEKPRNP
jgi:hypothetical protein